MNRFVNMLDNTLRKTFKDAKKFKLLLVVLDSLVKAELGIKQKQAVLDCLVDQSDFIIKNLGNISILFDLNEESLLENSSEGYEALAMRAMQKILPVGDLAHGFDSLIQTFGSSRNPQAIFRYAAGLSTLNHPEVDRSFKQFFLSVCDGTFQNVRYNPDINPQMQKIQNYSADLIHLWKQGKTCDLNDQLGAQIPHLNHKKLKIIDTDNPYDLLLSGTEVQGSCQRIDANIEYNKGLLGLLMNGARLLAVVDPNGVIQTKAVIRILFNQQEKPVLFIERLYGNARYGDPLLSFAKERAREFELPLAATEVGEGPLIQASLTSLGGPAPYEYSDAGGEICPQGIICVSRYCILQE